MRRASQLRTRLDVLWRDRICWLMGAVWHACLRSMIVALVRYDPPASLIPRSRGRIPASARSSPPAVSSDACREAFVIELATQYQERIELIGHLLDLFGLVVVAL